MTTAVKEVKLIGDNPRYEKWRWTTFSVTWLIYASFYLARKSFAVAKVAFQDDPRVSMTRANYGTVDSYYLTFYALGQFIWGPLGDRLGPKRILILGLLLCIAASTAAGFSSTFVAFLAYAIVLGLGQSTGWSNTVKTMSSWFSLRERGRIMGWWCTNYAIGAAIALPFAAIMMDMFGQSVGGSNGIPKSIIPYWPAGFWGPAVALSGVLLIVVLFLKNKPQDVDLPPIERYHGEPESKVLAEDTPTEEPEGSWKVVGEVLRVPSIWLLGASYFAIKLTRYAFYFWGPKFISESLGSDVMESALTAAVLPVGGAIGVIASGYISDNLFQSRRIPICVINLVATAFVMMAGLLRIPNAGFMAVFFFLVGFFLFGPDSIVCGSAAMDFGTKKGSGTAAGLVNGVGSIGAILGGWLPGHITSEENWSPVFYVFIGGLLFSAALLVPLWKTLPPTSED